MANEITYRCGVCGATSTVGWPACCATAASPHAVASGEHHAPEPEKRKGRAQGRGGGD